MDREFLARQIAVFIEHEPMFADATEEYRAKAVRELVEHLAGNWETIVKGQEQLAALRAARENQDSPMEFVITEQHMESVKLTPKESQNYMREYYGATEYQRIVRECGETIIEEIPNETIIGYLLSKLGIKR